MCQNDIFYERADENALMPTLKLTNNGGSKIFFLGGVNKNIHFR